jgi:hypothetical protein
MMAKSGQRQVATLDEQIEGLRGARDHYSALADQIRDGKVAPSDTPEECQADERNARRIAGAYDKSLKNMIAQINRSPG